MKESILIVGAGLSGATLARRFADNGNNVVVIDKLPHIAGSAFDYKDQNNITVHKYGSHIFHTSNRDVWNFVGRFAEFNTYMHKVFALIDGTEAVIPFNLNTIKTVFPASLATRIEEKLLKFFEYNARIPICEFQKQNDGDLKFLADYIYKKVFLEYTKKQWGQENIDSSVTARVPVVIGTDPRYFNDTYQGIPLKGYTSLVENMLDDKKIDVRLNECLDNISECGKFKTVYHTGSIDEFFDYKFGILPYRSLRFEHRSLETEYFQKNSVVNYPCNYDFTRIHEFKYYLNEKSPRTSIMFEYPQKFEAGKNDRYYPIQNAENSLLYNRYSSEAEKIGNLHFCGRLGDYKYYDMDKAIERALKIKI